MYSLSFREPYLDSDGMAASDILDVIELLDKGKSAEALSLSAKLIAETPTLVTPHVVHARAHESQEQYRDAYRSWRIAAELLPNSPLILKGLRRTAEKLSRPQKSEFEFMEWTSEAPNINVHQYEYHPPEVGSALPSEDMIHDDAPAASLDRVPEASIEVFADEALPLFEESESSSIGEELETEDSSSELEIDKSEDIATLPGFESSGSVFDVEPDFERQLMADMQKQSVAAEPADGSLDRLIADLETARIVPKPEGEFIPEPNLESNVEGMVSETLARIFATQKQFGEAARIYEKLAELNPKRSTEFLAKALEMKAKG